MAMKLSMPPLSAAKDPAAYPMFRGGITRLTWRIYTQRLTPAGRWLALISIILISYSGASLQIQAYVLAAYLFMIWAVAIACGFLLRPNARLHIEMASRVAAAQETRVTAHITLLSRLSGGDLNLVAHKLPPQIDSIPPNGIDVPDLRRGQTATVQFRLRFHARGRYTLAGFRLHSSFPFGIFRSRRLLPQRHSILVYPNFQTLERFALSAAPSYQPGGLALATRMGDSFEYLGNREYRQGDNPRDIDWRASARLQQPIVREWIEEFLMRGVVFLDTHIPRPATAAQKENFERAISMAAAVTDYLGRHDFCVELFAAGTDLHHLAVGRGQMYLDQVLDLLANQQPSAVEPFETVQAQLAEMGSRISAVVCIFLDWTESRRSFVRTLREGGMQVRCIIVSDDAALRNSAAGAGGDLSIVTRESFERGVAEL